MQPGKKSSENKNVQKCCWPKDANQGTTCARTMHLKDSRSNYEVVSKNSGTQHDLFSTARISLTTVHVIMHSRICLIPPRRFCQVLPVLCRSHLGKHPQDPHLFNYPRLIVTSSPKRPRLGLLGERKHWAFKHVSVVHARMTPKNRQQATLPSQLALEGNN